MTHYLDLNALKWNREMRKFRQNLMTELQETTLDPTGMTHINYDSYDMSHILLLINYDSLKTDPLMQHSSDFHRALATKKLSRRIKYRNQILKVLDYRVTNPSGPIRIHPDGLYVRHLCRDGFVTLVSAAVNYADRRGAIKSKLEEKNKTKQQTV